MTLQEERRDPLVSTLTERAAELVAQDRLLRAENAKLKREVKSWTVRCRHLQRSLDALIEREAKRCATGGQAGGAPVARVDKSVPLLAGQVTVDEALTHGQAG